MNFAERAFWLTLRKLVLIQSVLVIGLTVVLFVFYGKTGEYAMALIYGGFVSIAVTVLRGWRLKIATKDADIALEDKITTSMNQSESEPKKDIGNSNTTKGIDALELFKGFALGYIVAIGLLVFGLGGLKLLPAAVIIGFVVAQIGHFFVRPPKPGAGRR